jgi:predicted acetyltransferase
MMLGAAMPASTQPIVRLEPISRAESPVLANLFELYVHDFSELVRVKLKDHGRFDLPIDERWWSDAGHHPFFVRYGEELCGFLLARRGSRVTDDQTALDVAEFFVVRGARGQGVGRRAVHTLLASLPGPWEIRVRRNNAAALAFWQRALAPTSVQVTDFEASGALWHLLRVDANAR